MGKALLYVEKTLFIAGLLTEKRTGRKTQPSAENECTGRKTQPPADRRGLWAGKAEQGIEKGKKAEALRY